MAGNFTDRTPNMTHNLMRFCTHCAIKGLNHHDS
ncbi:hypothetical protein FOYG_10633 [Fusarium oxysporum NRRL 32931]|uniref:Uncharacterized protein n=1 Tax=Fusarium oxysporum NRRL 32931 TaxID=660029 RepID=W9HYX7_FUSOX|nr:hypothetical protein FOYG_10633 [Fusarium oxysporum NRRL 32931]